MQLLRSSRKIIMILICLVFLLTACDTQDTEADEMVILPMSVYTEDSSVQLPDAVLTDIPDGGLVFYYEDRNLSIQFYVQDSEKPAIIWINGEKYPFSYGLGYSPMESEAPFICVCDINNDTEPDVLVYGTAYRTELRQDVYVSDGRGGYMEVGDITWNKNAVEHTFSFCADYQNDYQVRISAPEWNIEEVGELAEELAEQLVSLGLYEDGSITEYGLNWEINQLCGKSVRYSAGEDGNTYLYYEALIEAGYSEYDIGYGFRFKYLIHDSGYELKNVEFLDCVTQ